MIIIIHLAIVLFLIKFLHLNNLDIFLAITFGLLIDLDHLYYYKKWKNNKELLYNGKARLHSFLQGPISLLWIIPLCWIIKNYIPLIFWLTAVIPDYLVITPKRPFWPISKFEKRIGLFRYGTKYEFYTGTVLLILATLYLILA